MAASSRVIVVSIRHPTAETRALRPLAYLVEPFGLRRLASALRRRRNGRLALSRRPLRQTL